MKLTEKTKCWVCRRTAKELKKIIEAYWQSGELGKDMDLRACFEIVEIKKMVKGKIKIPVCIICHEMPLQNVAKYLKENLEVTVKIDQPKVRINLEP